MILICIFQITIIIQTIYGIIKWKYITLIGGENTMKRMPKFFLALNMVLLLFAISSTVKAESNTEWKIWTLKTEVDIDKEWIIQFSDEIDPMYYWRDWEELSRNIYVVRERDNKRMVIDLYPPDFDFENRKKTVKIYLGDLYDFNETYYLYISNNLKSIKGTPLKEPIKMKFQTVNPEFNIVKTVEQDGIKFEVMLNTKDIQKGKKLYAKVKATNVSEDHIPYISSNGCDVGLHARLHTESDTGQVKAGSNWRSSLSECTDSVEQYFLEPGETIEILEILYPPTEGLKDNAFVKVTFQKGLEGDPLTPIEIPIAISNSSTTSHILDKDLE